jgi:NAD+ kinase
VPSIQSIAFVVNRTKPGATELVVSLSHIAAAEGIKSAVLCDYPLCENALEGFDVCCVIGGDGTLLGVVTEAVRHDVLVLGVNLGKLGFLATFSPKRAIDAFSSFLQGNFEINERTLLESLSGDGERALALNDIVIKNQHSSLILLDVVADGRQVTEYSCDGLIISTPTGSTAYNLSANGPIIHPQASALAMTPICPHTLSNRTLIFPASTEIEISCLGDSAKASLTRDGRPAAGQGRGIFPLKVRTASERLRLMSEPNGSYYNVLRSKLRWGEGGND